MKKFSAKLKKAGRKMGMKKSNSETAMEKPKEDMGAPDSGQNMRLSMDTVGAAAAAKYSKGSPVTPEPPEATDDDMDGCRRLSVDGDMLKKIAEQQKSAKPKGPSPKMDTSPVSTGVNGFDDEDAKSDDADDGTEKRVDVDLERVHIPLTLGGNSRAGWSKTAAADKDGDGQRKANQDSYGAIAPFASEGTTALISVFDGHGAEGRPSSQCVRDNVPRTIARHLRDTAPLLDDDATGPPCTEVGEMKRRFVAMSKAYDEAEETLKDEDSEIDHVFSGTTAVSSLICGQIIFTAWAGDSRAVLGRGTGMQLYPVDLSNDQKPGRSDEKKRVRASGGRVTRWKKNIGPLRVWLPDDWIPGLAMTRSVGDTVLTEYGVIPTPEVTVCGITPKDQFLVLASDGVWEFMSSGEVCQFIAKRKLAGDSPSQAANKLVAEAVKRWHKNEQVVDDTTAVIAYLDYKEKVPEGFERPQQLLENGDLIAFSPRNDDDKPL